MKSFRGINLFRIVILAVSISILFCQPVFADEPAIPIPSVDPVIVADSTPIVPPLIISELTWAGSSVSTSDEWVELYNRTDRVIDLAGYSLWDAAPSTPKLMLTIPSGQIGKQGYSLISNNGPDHVFGAGQSALSVAPDLVNSDVSLSNSSLKLELRDATGAVVDTVGSGGAGFLRDTTVPRSMVRTLAPLGDGTLKTSWVLATEKSGIDANVPDFGTPTSSGRPVVTVPTSCQLLLTNDGEQPLQGITVSDPSGVADIASVVVSVDSQLLATEQVVGALAIEVLVRGSTAITPGPLTLSIIATDLSGLRTIATLPCQRLRAVGEMLITELMGSPEDNGQEFVELQNVGASEVDLYGWTLDDVDDGGSAPYMIGYSLHLHSGERVALSGSETKLKFNNSGDDVQLLGPSGQRVDLVRFTSDETALSWNRGTPWYWSNPSPGRVNDDPPPIEPLEQGGSPADAALPQHLSLSQILTSIDSLKGVTIKTEATVAVVQGPYHARRLIIGDGQDFMELQVKEGVSFPIGAGTSLRLVASVSTSATPRLLLESVEDATTTGRADRPIGVLKDVNTQPLARLVAGRGQVEAGGASPTLQVAGQAVKLSRRSGLKLPEMRVGDTVQFLGVVTKSDPLQVRILEETDVTVDPVSATKEDTQPVAQPETAPSPPKAVADTSRSKRSVASVNPISVAEQVLSQLPLVTLTAGMTVTADVLQRRQELIAALSTEIAAASMTHQSTTVPTMLLILACLSGLAVLSLGSDLLSSSIGRRVNGP